MNGSSIPNTSSPTRKFFTALPAAAITPENSTPTPRGYFEPVTNFICPSNTFPVERIYCDGLHADQDFNLVERDSRAFRLTEDGRTLHVRTVGLLAEVNEIATALTHERGAPRGVLRVSCPLVFGHIAMSRIAAGFAQRFPDVHLEVTTEDRQVDLIEEGYDVVIRVNPGEDSQLVGRCLHRDTLFVAAPAGLVRPDDPETPIPTVTGSSALDLKRRTVVDGGVERTMTFKSVLRLPSLLMLRDAVLAGAGAGILPHMLVADALASGELQDWGTLPAPKVEVWALHASRRLTSGKVSAFLDFLTEATPAMFSK